MLSWCARASSRSRRSGIPNFTSGRARSAVEQGEQEVASEDFFEEKQSEGATESDFWRLVFMEKAAAEAEALRLRELHGLQREVKAVSTLSALARVFRPGMLDCQCSTRRCHMLG